MNLVILLAVVVIGQLCAGCQTLGYYCQAAQGQCEMLTGHRDVPEILQDPAEPESLKQRLRLAMELRTFAETNLGLPAGGSYRTYKKLDRPNSVWVVTASKEFSTELESWWYPVVGRFTARSYFDKARAEHYAQTLRSEGLEVHLGGARAYSTLGWFRDPLLSTFIHEPDTELAELLFHELAHRRLFIANDAAFNESMATAVGQAGVRRWLAAQHNATALAAYHQTTGQRQQFFKLLEITRDELRRLYATDLRAPDMRLQKQALHSRMHDRYLELKAQWNGYSGYDSWFAKPPSNPRMAAMATYYKYVPAFDKLLLQCGDDLDQFFAEAAALGKLPAADRRAQLERLMKDGPSRP